MRPTRATTPPAYMTVADAAAYVCVDPRTIRRWISAGILPGYRLGGRSRIRVKRDEIDAALLRRIPTTDAS